MLLVSLRKIREFHNKVKLLKFEGLTNESDTMHTNIEINEPKLVYM